MTEAAWKIPLAEFVRSRAAGRMPDEVEALAIVRQIVDALPLTTVGHAVRWKVDAWRRPPAEPALADAVERVAHGHIRPDGSAVLTREQVASHTEGPLDLFVAVMAWGFGERGYGWHRTRQMFGHDGQRRVPALVAALRGQAGDPAEIWRILRGPTGLPGLGPAFGTKLAYFANYRNEHVDVPLIADRWTAWGFWSFSGTWDVRACAPRYAEYVHRTQAWATRLNIRPDDLERAYFIAGPYIRQVWQEAVRPR